MGRIIRPDRRGRRKDRGDTGFTLVEVVLAIAILTVAVAATTAAISLAASARREGGVQITAAEIANQVLQQAEAFGCGLPVDYNGVSATDRLAACDYNGSEAGGDGLADVDFTTVRDGHSFDVEVRMRWYSLDLPPHANFLTQFPDPCQRQAMWADGMLAGSGTEYPTDAIDPTLLARTVTVTAPNGRSTVLESTETVRPELADPHHSGFVFRTTNANQKMRLSQEVSSVVQYTMTFHSDHRHCTWIPYLEHGGVDYVTSAYFENTNRWTTDKNQNLCDDTSNPHATSSICHDRFSP